MKNIKYTMIWLLLVFLPASCMKETLTDNGTDTSAEHVIEIVASHAKEDTKSVLGEGGEVLWLPQDSISVFYGNTYINAKGIKCISDNTSPSSTVSFFGRIPDKDLSPSESEFYYAFYPYSPRTYYNGNSSFQYYFPAVQHAEKDTFGPGCFPSFAKSKDLNMFFYNVCGGIKFSVTKEGVRTITLKSNADERISGNANVSFWGEYPECSLWGGNESDHSICLVAPEGGFQVGAAYYMVIPPTVFSSGFTLTFCTDTETATRVVDKRVEIRRNVFSKMTDADKSLTYEKQPSLLDRLAGPDGQRYWFWDYESEYDESTYGEGNVYYDRCGYLFDSGFLPGSHWGNRSYSEAFNYMLIDDDFNCTRYDQDGNVLHSSRFSIENYSGSYRYNGWGLGQFRAEEGTIMEYYGYNGYGNHKDYDIAYLTQDRLILSVLGEWNQIYDECRYSWWRFRSVSKETFEKGKPVSLSLDKTSVEVYMDRSFELKATVEPEECAFWGIKWETEGNIGFNGAVGKYYAYQSDEISPAKVIVTTAGGLRAECEVIVKYRKPVQSISIVPSELEILAGESATLNVIFQPEDASIKDLSWQSCNSDIATVDDSGNVTGIYPGEVTIQAQSLDNGSYAYCTVRVLPVHVTGVTLDINDAEMEVGDKLNLVATVLPENASYKTVHWSSDKTNVVNVDQNGVVRAVGSGKATVTVKTEDGNFVATCRITVQGEGMLPGIGDWEDGDHNSGEAV